MRQTIDANLGTVHNRVTRPAHRVAPSLMTLNACRHGRPAGLNQHPTVNPAPKSRRLPTKSLKGERV